MAGVPSSLVRTQCDLWGAVCTKLYTVLQFTLYSEKCALYNVRSTFNNVQCTVCTVQSILYSLVSTVYNCTLLAVRWAVQSHIARAKIDIETCQKYSTVFGNAALMSVGERDRAPVPPDLGWEIWSSLASIRLSFQYFLPATCSLILLIAFHTLFLDGFPYYEKF